MAKPKSICVFGDSTAWGAWDLEKGGRNGFSRKMKIFVKAKAGARSEEVKKIDKTHFAVAVKAPAKDGKANWAIEKAIAKHFGVPVSSVSIIKGHSGRQKAVEISC